MHKELSARHPITECSFLCACVMEMCMWCWRNLVWGKTANKAASQTQKSITGLAVGGRMRQRDILYMVYLYIYIYTHSTVRFSLTCAYYCSSRPLHHDSRVMEDSENCYHNNNLLMCGAANPKTHYGALSQQNRPFCKQFEEMWLPWMHKQNIVYKMESNILFHPPKKTAICITFNSY